MYKIKYCLYTSQSLLTNVVSLGQKFLVLLLI